jgi:sirohydrochlorin ferrochelatase
VVIIAHGGGPAWNAQVEAVARAVRHPGPVGVSFLMGPGAQASRFQDVVADLERRGARRVVVVPFLVSSHSGHYEQVRWLAGVTDSLEPVMAHHLELSGLARPARAVPIRVTAALDDSPEMARVLAARARALDPDSSRALLLIGHGPNSAEDYAEWMRNLRPVADSVRAWTGYRSVVVELVRDDAPAEVRAEAVARVRELVGLQREATGRDVLVVPVLVATGQVSREKFARDLAGLPVVYRGDALLPDTAMARWVEARIAVP